MEIKGLKKLRSGNGLSCTPANVNSRTQIRKSNLANYNVHQRKFGVNGVAK